MPCSARNGSFNESATAPLKAEPAQPQGAPVATAQQPIAQQAEATVQQEKPVHAEYGPFKSEYLAAGAWHAKVGAAATTYWPADMKHIVGGPRDSWFVPESYVHVAKGYDQSNWISPLVFHVEEGKEKSYYVPKDWNHMKTGPSASYHFPKGWNHLTDEANKSRMEYTVPGIDKPIRSGVGQPSGDKPKTAVARNFRSKFLLATNALGTRIPDGFLQTNEAFLGGLGAARPPKSTRARTARDVGDAQSVLSFLIESLPPEVTVYPSENYYYFVFAAEPDLVQGEPQPLRQHARSRCRRSRLRRGR